MTRADRLLIALLAAACLAAWPLLAAAGTPGQRVEIAGPSGVSSVPLDEECTLEIEGRGGELTVEVANGSVRVTRADCPDHVCVRTGAVSSSGAVVACIPNGVVIRVEGGDGDGLDARIR